MGKRATEEGRATACPCATPVRTASAKARFTRIARLSACHPAGGGHRQLTFTAGKRLRDGAYLKLGYMPVREVVSWEEVQPGQVPDAARERLA